MARCFSCYSLLLLNILIAVPSNSCKSSWRGCEGLCIRVAPKVVRSYNANTKIYYTNRQSWVSSRRYSMQSQEEYLAPQLSIEVMDKAFYSLHNLFAVGSLQLVSES